MNEEPVFNEANDLIGWIDRSNEFNKRNAHVIIILNCGYRDTLPANSKSDQEYVEDIIRWKENEEEEKRRLEV